MPTKALQSPTSPQFVPDWQTAKEFLQAFGLKDGLLVIFFLSTTAFIYYLYIGRIGDRQAEIERLAQENREYRERFLHVLDGHFGYKKPSERTNPPRKGRKVK